MAHILLVDDHLDTREVLAQLLGAHGHTVECCGDGHEALEMVERRCPDAAIVDQRLPGMTGLELIARFREMSKSRDLPVILCSADDSLRIQASSAGAHDFWVKGSDQLFEHVERLQDSLANRIGGGSGG